MAQFQTYKGSKLVKTMIAGDSKAGKTGAIASLVNDPLFKRVAIVDFDNGLDILNTYVDPANMPKLYYQSFDPMNSMSAERAIDQMRKWITPTEQFGPLEQWTHEHVFVLDSATFFGRAIIAALEAKGQIKDGRQLIGKAQEIFEKAIAFLYFNAGCHVVINTHLKISEDAGLSKTYPTTVGTALNSRIGRYTNNLWRIDCKPDGTRVIRTTSDHRMTLGSSAPLVLKAEEDFDLAKVFRKILLANTPKPTAEQLKARE